jgi:hypothetical protein
MDAAQRIAELEGELARLKTPPAPAEPLRLDFGCGTRKREGFRGVDIRPFEGVDFVLNAGEDVWPWADASVDEAHASHFIEHLTWPGRVHFFNELWRVLKPQAKATLIWPSPFSGRYYGDPTHSSPFSAFALLYLNAEWRKANAPHVDHASNREHAWHEYRCDFDHVVGYSTHPMLQGRPPQYVQEALIFCTEAAQDISATLTKRGTP